MCCYCYYCCCWLLLPLLYFIHTFPLPLLLMPLLLNRKMCWNLNVSYDNGKSFATYARIVYFHRQNSVMPRVREIRAEKGNYTRCVVESRRWREIYNITYSGKICCKHIRVVSIVYSRCIVFYMHKLARIEINWRNPCGATNKTHRQWERWGSYFMPFFGLIQSYIFVRLLACLFIVRSSIRWLLALNFMIHRYCH